MSDILIKRVYLRASRDEKRRWRIAAALEGVTLSEWIRRACQESAKE